MKLRTKIFSGFIILSGMLAIAGIWSIIQVTTVGESVQNILEENYKSISAAKEMNEALEREDSAILLYLLGNREEALSIMESAAKSFRNSFDIVKNNITVEGEAQAVEMIEQNYEEYLNHWKNVLSGMDTQTNTINWYMNNAHRDFITIKKNINQVIDLNDKALYTTSINLQERARRAIMPGVIAILAAIIFSLLFIYFINHYVVKPIISITKKIDLLLKSKTPFEFDVETDDEIGQLATKITTMSSYVIYGESKR